jgi:Flp pilus assembly pilin Flp
MLKLIKTLISDDSAQDLAEYGIALAVIGTVAGIAAVAIRDDVGTLWTQASNVIHAAI